jgi:hypothetical protein
VSSNRLIYATLGLSVLILIGMLTSSWRVVLYPFLLIIAICMLFGFATSARGRVTTLLMCFGVAAGYAFIFGWVDAISGGEPTGSTNYVLGMTPVTALYLIGVPLLVVVVGLLYALTFTREDLPTGGAGNADDEPPAERSAT